MKAHNILYMSEIIFIIVVPFIVFVQMKGYFSRESKLGLCTGRSYGN